jgi:hypothetical protein
MRGRTWLPASDRQIAARAPPSHFRFAIVGAMISPFLTLAFQGFGDASRWDSRVCWLEFGIGFT